VLGGSAEDTKALDGRDGDVASSGVEPPSTDGGVLVPDAVDGDALSEDGIQETPGSPSSSREGTSGYSAGSGSSTASIYSASGADESADRIRSQESVQLARRTWVPGKRHPDEVCVVYPLCIFCSVGKLDPLLQIICV
jgi:hypothetical protein